MQVDESMQAALSNALARSSWADTIDGVKSIVAKHLDGMDSSATIKKTSFFNHTFAPDITLTWPNAAERGVFLRFPDDVSYLTASVDGDIPNGSMVLGLGELEQRDGAEALASTSKAHETLVLDPPGIEALQTEKKDQKSGLPVVTAAVARGARGLFGRMKAQSVASTITQGLSGAASGDAEKTRSAATVTKEDFAPRESVPLEHLIQTFWIAGGSKASEYPGEFQARAWLGSEELRLVLDTAEVDDLLFWRQVGADVTLKELLAISSVAIPSNLRRLVQANVDRLAAKAAWVKPEQRLKEPEEPDFDWSLESGLLRLAGPTFAVYFARKKDRFKLLIANNKRDGITATDLLARAEGLGIREITQADTRRTLVFKTDDITQDSATEQVAKSFGADARVTKAQATVPGGTHVTVDFEDSTVVAVTNSSPSVGDLGRTAVKALIELDADADAAMTAFLSLPDEIPTDVLGGASQVELPEMGLHDSPEIGSEAEPSITDESAENTS